MDNTEYGLILSGYILNNLMYSIPANAILKRKNKTGFITKISPKIKCGKLDINNYLHYEQYNDTVLRFFETLETKLSHCKVNSFYHNIKNLTLKERLLTKKERLILGGTNGTYEPAKNIVTIFDRKLQRVDTEIIKDREDNASHELIHMSSTYKKGPIILMGFQQSIGKKNIVGKGLNEGYTERLNLKYFSHRKISDAYPFLQLISEGIENIVGSEKMEQLYFSADLKGLTEELEKYCPKKQVASLIDKIDVCFMYENEDYEKHEELAKELRIEIANIYTEKQRQLLESHQITNAEYQDNILKNGAFYIQGYKVEKQSQGYGYRSSRATTGRILKEENYQAIKDRYFAINKEPIVFTEQDQKSINKNVVATAHKIWHTYKHYPDDQQEYRIDEVVEYTQTEEVDSMLHQKNATTNKNVSKK